MIGNQMTGYWIYLYSRLLVIPKLCSRLIRVVVILILIPVCKTFLIEPEDENAYD